MTSFVDDFLEIGSEHRICQDYIISGMEPFPHVILADGCSSSLQTDTGARILVHMACQYLKQFKDSPERIQYSEMGKQVIHKADAVSRQLGLNPTALDATLIVAYILDSAAVIHIYGDGFVVLRNRVNECSTVNIAFTQNAPYYLSYQLDPQRDLIYRSMKLMKTMNNEVIPFDAETRLTLPVEQYPVILIASDGLDSFVDKSGVRTSLHSVAEEFTAFKQFKGEFLKRRVRRAVRDLEKFGFVHYDDLSVGAIIHRPIPWATEDVS